MSFGDKISDADNAEKVRDDATDSSYFRPLSLSSRVVVGQHTRQVRARSLDLLTSPRVCWLWDLLASECRPSLRSLFEDDHVLFCYGLAGIMRISTCMWRVCASKRVTKKAQLTITYRVCIYRRKIRETVVEILDVSENEFLTFSVKICATEKNHLKFWRISDRRLKTT